MVNFYQSIQDSIVSLRPSFLNLLLYPMRLVWTTPRLIPQ